MAFPLPQHMPIVNPTPLNDPAPFAKSEPVSKQTYANERWWRVVTEWMARLTQGSIKKRREQAHWNDDGSQLDWQVYFQAIRLLHLWFKKKDEKGEKVVASEVQLVASACLKLAGQVHAYYPPQYDYLIYMADNSFTASDLVHAECEILEACDYRLNNYLSPYDVLLTVANEGEEITMTDRLIERLVAFTLKESYLTHDSISVAQTCMASILKEE